MSIKISNCNLVLINQNLLSLAWINTVLIKKNPNKKKNWKNGIKEILKDNNRRIQLETNKYIVMPIWKDNTGRLL